MGNAIFSLILAFIAGVFCMSAMYFASQRHRKQDTDIDTILAQAERPFLQKVSDK